MNKRIIAVDTGRYKTKSLLYSEKNPILFDFESKFGLVDFNHTKNIPILDFDPKKDLIASIDGNQTLAYGKVTEKLFPVELIQFVTEDIVYLEYSINYTLLSIAQFVDNNDQVITGVNLTANNMGRKDEIRDKLIGKHNVKFYNTTGDIIKDVNFVVDKVGTFYQSWVSYLNEIITDDYDIKKEKLNEDVLILDLGRRTLDAVYIKNLSPTKPMSFNCGTERFFVTIKEQLYRQHNIIKKTFEIEDIILNKKTLKQDGKVVDLNSIIEYATNNFLMDIKNSVLEDFGNYNCDSIYVCGGGSIMFKDLFKEIFPGIIAVSDPVFSNVKGLLKLLVRKFVMNVKQGL